MLRKAHYWLYRDTPDSLGIAAVFFGIVFLFIPIPFFRMIGLLSLIFGIIYWLVKLVMPNQS